MNLFDQVLRFRFLVSANGTLLGFNEKLVYSYLVYRFCLIKHVKRLYPTTATRIGAATGLDRRTTVSKALAKLADFGLVYKRGSGWYAREPEGPSKGWFRWMNTQDARRSEWYDRFAYQWHPVPGPACQLTPRQLYLFGMYASLIHQGKPLIADKYLVKLSGLDVSTVRTARQKLFNLGLMVDDPTGWRCLQVDASSGWFLPTSGEAVEVTPRPTPPDLHRAIRLPEPLCQSSTATPTRRPDDADAAPTVCAVSMFDIDQLDEATLDKIYSEPLTAAEREAFAEIDEWEVEWEMASAFKSNEGGSDWFDPCCSAEGFSDEGDLCFAGVGEEIP